MKNAYQEKEIIDNQTKEAKARFDAVIVLLEKSLKYLEALRLDPALLRDSRRLLSYLKGRPDSEVCEIFGSATTKKRKTKRPAFEFTDEEISGMSDEHIHELLRSVDLPRSFLEKLAAKRFSVTAGALSTLRTNEALREKILNLLSHEDAHAAISRAVNKGAGADGLK